MNKQFFTSDGYTLLWGQREKQWSDGDMSFDSDSSGWPVDDTGMRLEGTLSHADDKE